MAHSRAGLRGTSAILLSLLAAACSIRSRPETRFAGTLTSTSPSCPATQGTLIIRNAVVIFSPDDGTWTLSGTAANGVVEASHDRPSFDHKVFVTKLTGTYTARELRGTYTTPVCTYAVRLTRY